jgi:hypothetical protein
MDEVVAKIMAELLTTLALATKEVKQGKSSESDFVDQIVTLLSATQSNL